MPIQYKAERAPQDVVKVQQWLNQLGNDNWELVAYTQPGGLAIFKKPGSSETEEEKP